MLGARHQADRTKHPLRGETLSEQRMNMLARQVNNNSSSGRQSCIRRIEVLRTSTDRQLVGRINFTQSTSKCGPRATPGLRPTANESRDSTFNPFNQLRLCCGKRTISPLHPRGIMRRSQSKKRERTEDEIDPDAKAAARGPTSSTSSASRRSGWTRMSRRTRVEAIRLDPECCIFVGSARRLCLTRSNRCVLHEIADGFSLGLKSFSRARPREDGSISGRPS